MMTASDILHGKILIVDDQQANVLLLEQMLRGAGYSAVSSTMDPTQVCELHLRNDYSLILLDLLMPGMDGFQVMENLTELERDAWLPVLVITAQPDHKLRALRAGAKDFISKPFDLAEVLARVHNLLEVRLLHQESKRLNQQLLAEKKIAEGLLSTILPLSVVDLLQRRGVPLPEAGTEIVTESHAEATLIFADLLQFTTYAEGASARVLIGVLDNISDRLKSVASKSGLDRTEVMGDAYLAGVGLPGPIVDRSVAASRMALDLMEALDRFNAHSRYKLRISIGIDYAKPQAGKPRSLRAEFKI